MIQQLDQLESAEKDFLLDMIPMITVLIGAADGMLDNNEVKASERIMQIRSYSHSNNLSEYYDQVGPRFSTRVNELINSLPRDTESRNKELSEEISKVNSILKKMRDDQAEAFLTSWRSFAKHVAKSSGGFLSYLSESPEESALVDLPMIQYSTEI